MSAPRLTAQIESIAEDRRKLTAELLSYAKSSLTVDPNILFPMKSSAYGLTTEPIIELLKLKKISSIESLEALRTAHELAIQAITRRMNDVEKAAKKAMTTDIQKP